MAGLLRNISWLGSANIAVKPFWFVFITAVCMRVLGTDGYGILNAALALSLMATTFTDLGMVRYSVREVARDRTEASRYFTNFLTLRAAAVVLAFGITLIAALALGYRGAALSAVGFAAVYTLSMELTNYCRSFYQAFEVLRMEAIMLVAEKVLVIGGGLALLLTTRTPEWTLAGMAGGMVITTTFNAAWVMRRLAPFRPALFDRQFVLKALRVMVPLGLGGVFFNIYFRVDMVMVEALLGETAAGQYGAAFRILEALNMLPSVVVIAAIYPRLSRLFHAENPVAFRQLHLRSQLGLGAISLGIAAALAILGPWIITLLDPNPMFAPAGGVLQILCWAFPFLCVNALLYSALVAAGDERITAMLLGGAVLANVGLNAVFIPMYGIQGAAVATIIPEVLLAVAYGLRFRRRTI